MRIFLSGLIVFCLFATTFALNIDALTPEKRSTFASDWLETGKAYYANKKMKKAKNCYLLANRLYPMGQVGEEARTLLKQNFDIRVEYNPDEQFGDYIKRAEKLTEKRYKLNNYLMALEIKQDNDVLHKVALLYLSLEENDKAKEYLQKALDAGFPEEKVNPSLKKLLQE